MLNRLKHLCLIISMINITLPALELEIDFDRIEGKDALPSVLIKSSDSAYAENIRGLDALKAGKYDRAIDHFTQAFSLLPGYWDAENNRGVAYFRKGNIVLAENTWKKVVQNDPDYAIALYNLGIIAFHEHKHDDALDQFKFALKKRHHFTDALVMIGRIHMAKNNKSEALSSLEKAYKLKPSNQNIWSTYAYALIQTGDTTAAKTILKKQSKSPEAYQLLGQIAFAQKKYDSAIRLLTKSVSLGGPVSLLYQIADTELERGSCVYALKAMKTYFKKSSRPTADAWLVAGVASKECDNLKQAKEYFKKGVTAYPKDPFLRLNLGHIYFREKKYDKAEKLWSPLSDTMQDPELFHLRAIAARYQNNLPAAIKFIRKAITLDSKAEFHDFYGVVLHQQGKKKEAATHFKKALSIDPTLSSAQLNLALSDKSASAVSNGIKLTKQRLDTCHRNCPDITLELSVLYFHAQKVTEAIKLLKNIPPEKRSEKTYKYLAIYLTHLQQWDGAIRVLEKARKDLVLDLSTETQLVNCYMKGGYYNKATIVLKDLLVHWEGNRWRIYYQLGYAYLEQNKLDIALKHFKSSLKCKRNNIAARGMLAFLYNRSGNIEKARGLWRKNLENDPKNPTLWINLGLLLEKEGKYTGAIANYRKAYSLDKSKKEIFINIGNAYAEMKKYKNARIAYSTVLQSSKREIGAYNTFIAAQKEKNHGIAKKMLVILRKEFPKTSNFKRADAEMLLWNEDTTKAISILENLSDKNAEDNFTLARLYIAVSSIDKAQIYINKIPQNKEWRRPLAQLYASLSFAKKDYHAAYNQFKAIKDTNFYHQYNMALAAFKSGYHNTTITLLINKVPHIIGRDKADVLRLLGNANFSLKNWQKARSWYLQLSALESKKGVVQYNLAVASFNLGKIKEAWKYYENSKALDPTIKNEDLEKAYYALIHEESGTTNASDSTEDLFNKAAIGQNNGNDTLAERLYFNILKRDKHHSNALSNLGTLYGARGDFDNSIKYYKKAIKVDPKLTSAYANLIKIYIALEDLDKAKTILFKGKMVSPYDVILLDIEEVLHRALNGEDVLGIDSTKNN